MEGIAGARAGVISWIAEDGMTHEQIASLLGRTPGATREFISQCRKRREFTWRNGIRWHFWRIACAMTMTFWFDRWREVTVDEPDKASATARAIRAAILARAGEEPAAAVRICVARTTLWPRRARKACCLRSECT